MIKRAFDIVFSLSILLLFFWVLLISWLLAAVDTHTNGLFIQERIGQYGARFKIYKLRTIPIRLFSEKVTISRIGRLLRKYKVDELPQLFNVLKGEMSIVGPRPDLPGYYDLLEGENRKILKMKPGLTCSASLKYSQEELLLEKQVQPLIYNDTVIFPDKVKLNLAYYYHQSFWGDIAIILKTILLLFLKIGNAALR